MAVTETFTGAVNAIVAVLALVTAIGGLLWRLRIAVQKDMEATTKRYVEPLATKVDDLSRKTDAQTATSIAHQEADSALFTSLGNRMSTSEGKIEVLIQVLASQVQGKEGTR